jgi:hypothetical protein
VQELVSAQHLLISVPETPPHAVLLVLREWLLQATYKTLTGESVVKQLGLVLVSAQRKWASLALALVLENRRNAPGRLT